MEYPISIELLKSVFIGALLFDVFSLWFQSDRYREGTARLAQDLGWREEVCRRIHERLKIQENIFNSKFEQKTEQ